MNRAIQSRIGLVCGIALAGTLAGLAAREPSPGTTTRHTLEAGGLRRSYAVHAPPELAGEKSAPLVFVFHGSGDDGLGMESFGKFSALADRAGFVAVYPDAISRNWNDGREAGAILSQLNRVDDVAFVGAMIRALKQTRRIDPNRIFAAGFSNGGIFVHYLASQLSEPLAAIADVSGGIAEPLAPKFRPAAPVSVLMIHGTKDPMVPYGGGDVDFGGFGRIIDTEAALRLWTRSIGAKAPPRTGALPDADPRDQCRGTWTRWSGEKAGIELLLYRIEGGGHTWPGGPQFLPAAVIGPVCRDFDATEAIWNFFEKHPKP
jgi:polyhydroxybutyrate depolymerase